MLRLLALGFCLTFSWMLTGCNEGVGNAEVSGAEEGESSEIHHQNPFEIRTESPFPVIEVPERVFDFGRMALGEEHSHAFVIKNVGEVPVRLAMGETTCQCTLGKLENDVLEPGEQTDVVLTWKPIEHSHEFAKGATIWTDAPEMQKIEFTVRGKVVPQLGVLPGNTLSAGMIQDGVPTTVSVLVCSLLEEDFEILSIDVSDDWLQVTSHESTESTLRQMEGLKGYDIFCDVLPSAPVGEFRGTFTVNTNIEGPDYEHIVFTVSGTRAGPFSITGRGWSGQSYGTFVMGEATAGEDYSAELSLVMPPMEQPLELTLLEASPEFLGFEMRRDEAYPVMSRERYYLTFTVPADAPLGDWTGENAGYVKLRTNIPDRDELSIRVNFTVREPE